MLKPCWKLKKTKFLGVVIDNQLSWQDHITYISGKIARGIGILIKARAFLNRKTLVTLYYSFVYPYLIYCNHIWGTSCAKNIKRLHVLQKKAIRIICNANPRCHSAPLFKELKLLNIWQINKFLIGQFMYKSYHKTLPSLFDNYFVRFDTRDARHSLYYILPPVRTDYRKASIGFRGPSIWNDIIRKKVSPDNGICTFKYNVKYALLNDIIKTYDPSTNSSC